MNDSRELARPPRFEFCKARNKKNYFPGSPDGKPTHDGRIRVYFTLNEIKYGPYSTGMFTFRSVWDGRKQAKMPEASRLLNEELGRYLQFFRSVYRKLIDQLEANEDYQLLDGDTLMAAVNAARNQNDMQAQVLLRAKGLIHIMGKFTLQDLYNDFMICRKLDVQPDRVKRHEEQISKATYASYPKRWAMIEVYLVKHKKLTTALRGFSIQTGEELRAFLKTYRQPNGKLYAIASVNKALSLLKQLFSFALRKGYVKANPFLGLACRGVSPIKPKPLTEEQMQYLEEVDLPATLRHVCDSWLIAAELCLHHVDYMRLPKIQFHQVGDKRYIQHDRSKQQGDKLLQTVDVTARAERLLAKYGGPANLYYRHSGQFSDNLKRISLRANLVDQDGIPISLQFGMGRDTGLTARGIRGANDMQMTRLGGWSSTRPARRYIGLDLEIIAGFATNSPVVSY